MRCYEVGFWDIDGPEGRAFFHQIQPQSVFIACERCERPVPFPPKTLCAFCVSASADSRSPFPQFANASSLSLATAFPFHDASTRGAWGGQHGVAPIHNIRFEINGLRHSGIYYKTNLINWSSALAMALGETP